MPAMSFFRFRKLSLMIRFNRFRSTARRTFFFEMANPSLASELPFGRHNTVKQRSLDFSALRNTLE